MGCYTNLSTFTYLLTYLIKVMMLTVCADNPPVCEADNLPVVSGTNNNITCIFNYTRFSTLSPAATLTTAVSWPDGESGNFQSFPDENHRTGTLTATVPDMAVTDEGIAAINWTLHFVFSVQSTFKHYADNNDTWTWTSDIIPISRKLQLIGLPTL